MYFEYASAQCYKCLIETLIKRVLLLEFVLFIDIHLSTAKNLLKVEKINSAYPKTYNLTPRSLKSAM